MKTMTKGNDVAVREKISKLLQNNNSLTLATVTPELSKTGEIKAQPWAADLFFASDEHFTIYFISNKNARHSQDIQHNVKIAATVSQSVPDWFAIKGLQISGIAKHINDQQSQKALTIYLKKFPQLQAIYDKPTSDDEEKIREQLINGDFYCIEPQWIRVIENSQGFAYKEELVLR